jgi:alpha-tubulin suppressor-like RCC1 family protein
MVYGFSQLRPCLLLVLLIFFGCNQNGESPSEAFGIKEMPDININLLSVNPSNTFLEINQTKQFYATGGSEPYTFSLNSGGGSLTSTGFYTAPSYQTNAVIKVTDAKDKEAYATVVVNIPISMSPASITIASNSNATFTASGGIPPYTYSIVSGSGSIGSTSGIYDSTAVPPGTAIIKVTDSSGNAAFSAATINPSLIISPSSVTIGKGESIQLSATGGSLPYIYSVISGSGSVDPSTGVFTATSTVGTTFVRVTDNDGITADSIVNIVNKPQILPEETQVPLNGTLQFSAFDGTPPYSFSIVSGPGSINPSTGLFTANSVSGVVTVRVTDNSGFEDDTNINVFIPTIVAVGVYHTCALSFSSATSSTAKCWGASYFDNNLKSMLGNSDPKFFVGDELSDMGDNLPYLDFGTGVDISDIAYGRNVACALSTANKLYCFGYGNSGPLFQGNSLNIGNYADEMGDSLVALNLGSGRTVNTLLPFEDALSVKGQTACAILDDNSLKCWGSGSYARRGSGDSLHYGDSVTETGDNLSPVNLAGDIPVQVSVNDRHTCVRFNTGNIKCWGYNAYGQLGYEDTAYRANTPANTPDTYGYVDLGTGKTAKQVVTGEYHTCAILNDDSVKCWGINSVGDLGYGDNLSRGHIAGTMGDFLPVVDLGFGKYATKLVASDRSTCALLNDNTVKCWGYNNFGNLGQGHTSAVGLGASDMGENLPVVDLGSGRTVQNIWNKQEGFCAKLDDNSVKCWGYNQLANVGVGHLYDIGKSALSMGDNLAAINFGTGRTALKVVGGDNASCALLDNNKVKCWGYVYRGDEALAIGDAPGEMGAALPAIQLPTGKYFKDIRSSGHFNCGRTQDDKLYCWGANNTGALGIESTANQAINASNSGDNLISVELGTGLNLVQYNVGEDHACALLDDNSVKCWGSNAYGKLGSGVSSGASGNTMGDFLPALDLGSVSYPVKLDLGYRHTCALFANGKIKCWGDNTYGTLGYGDTTDRGATPATQMGDNLPFVDIGTGKTAVDICSGAYVNCAHLSDNSLRCWGYRGRSGSLSTNDIGDAPGEMGDNLIPIDLGSNFDLKKVSCNGSHVCALSTTGKVKCWGSQSYGRLGDATSAGERGDAPNELGDYMAPVNLGTNRRAVDVYAGRLNTCVVLDNNKVKCWGYNSFGGLGLGHRSDMGISTITIGDNLPYVEFE